MSIDRATNELVRFLSNEDPEVLCIRGEWGVGKTYALKEVAKSLSLTNQIALPRFSYVSLFGIGSLSELKSSIFDNTMSSNSVFDIPEVGGALINNLPGVEKALRKGRKLQAFLPGAWGSKNALILMERAAFSFVKKQVVCLDDLERAGKEVGAKEVLGIASFLKEERGCKVIIILNDEKLTGADAEDYKAQFEKVVDSSIVFEPTLKEIAKISIDEDLEKREYFEECIVNIRLRNIRVVSKIQRMIRLFIHECGVAGDDLKQVIATLTLAGWVKFEAGSLATLEDLKEYNSLMMEMAAQRDGAEPLPDWVSIPNALSYGHSDQVDRVIIEALDRGYVDPLEFAEAKAERDEELGPSRENEEFSGAWDLYHGRLDKSDAEIVDAILEGMRSDYRSVSLLNFNGTIRMFRELGFDEKADAAIEEYFAEKDFDRRQLDKELRMWGHEDIDPAISERFEALKAEYVDERDPKEVLRGIAATSSWNPEDMELLSGLGKERLIDELDQIQNPGELRSVLKFLIRFAGSTEPEYKAFGEASDAALMELSARSTNNEQKIRALGYRPVERSDEP